MKLSTFDRDKIDIADDQIFYQQPRYVHHLSDSFRNRLTRLYSEYLFNHHVILDLMRIAYLRWQLIQNKQHPRSLKHLAQRNDLAHF